MTGWTAPPLPVRWSSAARPVFVGRSRERRELDTMWAAVQAGARQVAFLGGEPGVGKSRLVAEVATGLHRQGATVLVGTCVAEFGAPYQPFVEPLEALLGVDGAPLAGLDSDRLGRVVGRGNGPPGIEHRRELLDAVAQAMALLARRAPLVLVLEDLHWAGDAALQLLTHLVERTPEFPVLVLGTHRTTAPDRSPGLISVISALHRVEGVRRLDLGGLDTEDIALYLRRVMGMSGPRARSTAALLRDQTGGNAFFLRELWHDVSRAQGWPGTAGWVTPMSVVDALAGRLDRLREPDRQTLELAAVVGEEVDAATLLAASSWARDATLAGLDAAAAFGLLEPPSVAGSAFRFPHALARQAVLELMPATRRARQHERVAAVIEAAWPPSDERARRLAQHYAAAEALGHAQAAVRYLTEAAEAAVRGLAHEEAARWFEQAAALCRDPEQRDALALAAAGSHLRGGDCAQARALAREVASRAAPRIALAAAIEYEAASWRPGRPGHRAVELLTTALRGVTEDPADPLYVHAVGALGRACAFTGDTGRAAVLSARSIGWARALDDDRLLCAVLQASLWLGLRPAEAGAKLARATELSVLADRTGDLDHLGPAAYFRGVIAYLQGDAGALDQAHADLQRMARATGQEFFSYMSGCVSYARAYLSADLAEAERTCTELLELGTGFGSDDTEGSCAVQTFMVRRETGRLEQVRPLITGEEDPAGYWTPGLLALYTELGLDRPAGRLLHWLLDGRLNGYQESAQWPCVLAFLTEAAVHLGDEPALRAVRPMLTEYAGLNLVAGQFVAVFGSADRYLGLVDSLLGAPGAEDELRAAVAQDVAMGAVLHEAQSCSALVDHLRRVGAPPSVEAPPAARARELAARLGLRRPATVGSVPVPPAVADPAGLTAREREVLVLVGAGLLNREISDRLTISENTVANHVRAVLAKTGASNRTQAALYAAAHGLLEGPVARSERFA